ncbi:DUF4145 domain-containing protein [Streptomyces cyaneofuscatus]
MANLLLKDLRTIARGLPERLQDWPHIPCPTCARGSLLPVHDSYVAEESNTSKSWREHDAWDPDWIRGAFHCLLACSKPTCDVVRVVGEMAVGLGDYDFDEPYTQGPAPYREVLTPNLFIPALPLVESRKFCPEEVGDRVDAAARVLWLDPSAAANRLRAAAEALMDDRGVIRTDVDRKGKAFRLTLDRRIAIFKSTQPQHADAADFLLAVKWIGNVGSHDDVLHINDVLEGVEFLDHALSLIYDESRDEVRKRASEVTARKGQPKTSL